PTSGGSILEKTVVFYMTGFLCARGVSGARERDDQGRGRVPLLDDLQLLLLDGLVWSERFPLRDPETVAIEHRNLPCRAGALQKATCHETFDCRVEVGCEKTELFRERVSVVFRLSAAELIEIHLQVRVLCHERVFQPRRREATQAALDRVAFDE